MKVVQRPWRRDPSENEEGKAMKVEIDFPDKLIVEAVMDACERLIRPRDYGMRSGFQKKVQDEVSQYVMGLDLSALIRRLAEPIVEQTTRDTLTEFIKRTVKKVAKEMRENGELVLFPQTKDDAR